MTYRTPSRPWTFAAALLAALAAACDSPTKPEPRDPVGSVTLPAEADLAVGRTVQLTAEVRDTLDNPYTLATVAWSSSSDAVATVDASGLVRGVGPGTATITAKAGTKQAQATVHVANPYTVVFLGGLDGSGSRATAINELGHVVGHTGTRGWIWKDGTLTALGAPPPRDINDRGQVVGDGAYLWENGTVTKVYPAPGQEGARPGNATALNERGDVVGNWVMGYTMRHLTHGAFLYRDGVVTELPEGAQAYAINEDGTVAGRSYLGPFGYYWEKQRAFVYRDGVLTELSDGHAGAFAMNDAGELAGFTRQEFGPHLSTWSGGGSLRILGRAARTGRAINNHGHVVGAENHDWMTYDPGWDKNPFLWNGQRFIDLNAIAAESDWVLVGAADINDRGQIVGWGHHRGSDQIIGALLLDPPAP